MSPVIVVFFVWFAIVVVLGLLAIAMAPHITAPQWWRTTRARTTTAIASASGSIGRVATAFAVAFAMWSVVIVIGWILGRAAFGLQSPLDVPAFHWWQNRHLSGPWHDAWWKLTQIGSPKVTQILTVAFAVIFAVVYWGRRNWWAPSVTLLVGYQAEKFSQIILKYTVHRGHPPTTLGSYPSGGMGRLELIYGLIIFFAIRRFEPVPPRVWAAGWSVLAIFASIQAYARLNNLEHWTTDVIGGAVFGLLLLATMTLAHVALDRGPVPPPSGSTEPASAPAPEPEPAERTTAR